jgi:hypothetical protein
VEECEYAISDKETFHPDRGEEAGYDPAKAKETLRKQQQEDSESVMPPNDDATDSEFATTPTRIWEPGEAPSSNVRMTQKTTT